jgi:predicted MPP superfamily phosphohydrolase
MSDAMGRADEALRVQIFVLCVGAVYLAAVVALVGRFLARPRIALRLWSRTALGLAALGVACMLYGRFVEPRWIDVTRTRVETTRLPVGHRGVRIVHLSDLHCDPSPLVEERLPAVVAELKPDLIVFTGDAANSPEGVPVFRRCLTEIAKIAPTFAVKGNWDAWYFPEIGRFDDTGATELDGTSATVVVDGAPVRVVGVGFLGGLEGIAPAFAALPADGPAVVLYHPPYPDVVPPKFASRVDLLCAGHVHGGQVAMPFYGALLTLSKYGKKYERGLYRADEGFPMFVSRGVGMEGGASPRVRFCSRPEVALIELVPAAVTGGADARR